jgi:hypothetical protein
MMAGLRQLCLSDRQQFFDACAAVLHSVRWRSEDDCQRGHVLAALDLAHVRTLDAGHVRQRFLRLIPRSVRSARTAAPKACASSAS